MKHLISCLLLLLSATCMLCSSQHFMDTRPVHDYKLIERINANPDIGWTATKYQRFEGMTLADARKLLGTVIVDPVNNLPRKSLAATSLRASSTFDAREKWGHCVHEIRDQAECGSCWAFSASEVVSDRLCIATNGTADHILSPQYMLECDHSNYGCDGGYLNLAWSFLAKTGIPTEECDPYYSGKTGKVSTCPRACKDGSQIELVKVKKNSVAHLKGIPDIQKDIQNNGPVQAAFTVYKDFFSYKKGVYRHVSGGMMGGHAIKIVGWGVTSDGHETPYWIVANSWGTSWGVDGHFLILRGKDECGIEDNVWSGEVDI